MRWRESATGLNQIDETRGIIHGVKVIGIHSRNRRKYKESTLRKALPLYEGSQVFVDHDRSGGDRSLKDGWGVLQSVRYDNGAIFADLHYLKSHPMTAQLLERAKRFPEKFGMSHDASGDKTIEDGIEIVESISKVHSVDIVADPATNKSLFESRTHTMSRSVKSVLEANKSQVPLAKRLLEIYGDEGAMDDKAPPIDDMAMPSDMPTDLPPEMPMDPAPAIDAAPDMATGEMDVGSAFRAILVSIIDDTSADIPTILKRIKIVLKAQADITAALGSGTEDTADTPDDAESEVAEEEEPMGEEEQTKEEPTEEEEPMAENYKKIVSDNKVLREQLDRNILEQSCHKMLLESRVEPTSIRVTALMAVKKDDRKALVEQFVGAAPKNRPARSPSILASSGGGGAYPGTTEAFKKSLSR